MGTKTDDILIAIKGDIKNLDASLVTAQKKIDKMVKRVSKSSRSMEGAFSRIGGAVKAYIGIQAGKWLLNLVGDVDSVKKSFNNMASDVHGGSKKLLADIKTAARGTVSELEIMRSSNLAISLMGKEVTDHLPKMMEVARVAARTQGKSVQQMYDDIIVASGRQSVMILDNLGISSATASRYQEEYAAKLGKTRQQLNATEKRAAFFFAVMKAGNDLMDIAGAESLTMGERLQIVKSRALDAAATFSEKLTPGLEEFVTVLTETDEKMGDSILGTLGDAISDVLVLFSRLILQIKAIPSAAAQAWKDAGDYFAGGGRRAAYEYRKQLEEQINDLADKAPAKAASLMKQYMKSMGQVGFNQDYLDNSLRLLQSQSKYSKYKKPAASGGGSGRGAGAGGGSGSPGGTGKKGKWKWSEYYSMMGMDKEADMNKLQEKYLKYYEENKEYFINHKEDIQLLNEQYHKQALEIEDKYNKEMKLLEDGMANAAKSAMSSFENSTKSALKNALLGKGGWKEWKNAVKEILAGLVVDITFAIAKALILRSITAAFGGSLGGGMLLGGMFEKGRVPVFEAGHIPVYSSGRIPDDHFIAAIGQREAVITAEATRANYDLLQQMNASGERLSTEVNLHNVLTLDGQVVYEGVEKRRQETANLMGANSYHKRNVNR